jgi:hypothetical protein
MSSFAFLLLAAVFSWHDLDNGRVELRENDKPVLVYNYGVQATKGAPADRARCCYIYPAFTPNGVNPLDDAPTDHWHHRGLFWAWPKIEAGGRTYDLWMYPNMRHEFGEILEKSANGTLRVKQYWVADGKRWVRETVEVRVPPLTKGAHAARVIEVALTLEALEAPVTIYGSPDEGKAYGGFNARFATRESTVIHAGSQRDVKDQDRQFHESATLEGTYGGKRAGLTIEAKDPQRQQWCLRHYGFVGASYPGYSTERKSHTLEKGKPLTLRYEVRLEDLP